MSDSTVTEWAQHYARHGYRVIPIKPNEKRPPMGAWQDAATTNSGQITAWWEGRYADHGIGIVCGATADGQRFIVLDIDEHDPNNSGSATLKRHEQIHGILPPTVEARTGSGGRHLIYRLADHHPEPRNGAGRLLGPGIDIRATNSQIVVAPTRHPNGNRYEWVNGHGIGERDAETAPDWLLTLLTADQPTPHINKGNEDDQRAGTRFNRETTWDSLLSADGWTPHHRDQTGTYYWTRPGKDPRAGTSASVNHAGLDLLTVFTTSIANLPAGTYDRFGYWTQTRHRGDFTAAARQLHDNDNQQITQWVQAIQQEQPPTLDTPDGDPLTTWYIDWPTLWRNENDQGEWLIEPILARGRAHALYAGAKSGKSLLLLEIAAALATGRPILGTTPQPTSVLYVDYEMTAADIRDRLEAFGYDETADLSRLHYVLLPSIAGLDTQDGARTLIAAVQHTKAQLVIIDTTARAVEGEENDADTMRAFYRWSGVNMKSLGVTWVRADHAGKDKTKGQRGTSAKNDDVDVVWSFTKRNNTSILLEATHRRMAWIPDKVEIELRENDNRLNHSLTTTEDTPAAVECARWLAALGAPLDLTTRAARSLLKDHGHRAANDILRAALRIRRRQQADSRVDGWLDEIEGV